LFVLTLFLGFYGWVDIYSDLDYYRKKKSPRLQKKTKEEGDKKGFAMRSSAKEEPRPDGSEDEE